ncbi:MAG: hypothetical protein IPM92_15400 [Saprospiraceae bacterium]|nr:hypothetical protein [Saprospiraceae bacterium]
MYVIRDTFRLKFGMFKEAAASMRSAAQSGVFNPADFKMYADFTGDSYRLILESRFDTLSEYENRMLGEMQKQSWKDWYQQFKPNIESSHREILRELNWA